MAGLYIHIPFCAKRCLYCDFFSNTDMKFKEPYIDAAIREMELRQEYIGGEPLDTIYFGGGTPPNFNRPTSNGYSRLRTACSAQAHAQKLRWKPILTI